MATLDQLRAKLNGEIGVATDGDTAPWSATVRNNAIIDGYAELWRAGVWKLVQQEVATVNNQWVYALTSIRRLESIDLLDSDDRVLETPRARVRDDGVGGYELRLADPLDTGYTMRVRGWTAYKSQFSGGSDTDDLAAEYNRIPLLKAKTILWRAELARFMKTGEAQALPPGMNVTVEGLLASIAAGEREFAEEAAALARLRPRVGQTRQV